MFLLELVLCIHLQDTTSSIAPQQQYPVLIIFNISQICVPLLTLPEFIVVKILQIQVGPNVIWFYYIQHFCLYSLLTLAFLCSQS